MLYSCIPLTSLFVDWNLCEVCEEQEDAYVVFMHPRGPKKQFHWPYTQGH